MNNSNEAPLPNIYKFKEDEMINDYLPVCSVCSSVIEILSINEEKKFIEYKCIKENKVYNISIKEYLDKIKESKTKNINELKDKCKNHNNKNYISYCFDCKFHLCNECLKTRIHINHRKTNIIEIKPIDEELNIIEEVINDYELKLKNIKIEQKNKRKELEEILNKGKRKQNKKLEKENIINKDEEIEEMKKNNKNYINDIEEIRKRYEKEIKIRKLKYEEENNNIKNKYKLINEKVKMKYELKIEKLKKNYIKEINKCEFEKKIENNDNILKINKIIFNIYNNYNDNYYNSLNINSLLIYYIKNEIINKNIIKEKLKDNYNKIIKIIELKRFEDKKKKEEEDERK